MRRLILPLLTASYFSLSLIFAVLIWRNGGGWGAGVAALAGGHPLAVDGVRRRSTCRRRSSRVGTICQLFQLFI